MKALCSLLFLLCCTQVIGQEWESDFVVAQEKAQQENKKLLLVFSGSDWCIPCIRLEKEVWENDTFLAYAMEKLILYRADFPKRKKNQLPATLAAKNQALAEEFNPKGYFPWVVVFEAKGKAIGTFVYTGSPVEDYIKTITDL
ncbi:MAG: thioredoxin family protein [Flavobacteriaceae bacterium]